MLTSGCRTDQHERCLDLGIAALLLKPVSQSELLNSVMKIVEPADELPTNDSVLACVEQQRPTKRLRVLLAEDHIVNQKVASHMLENLGHHATVVADGLQALAALEAGTYDVVLMDIQMPEMDGFQAVARLRERERATGGHTRVIALTAHALKGDRERCLEAGFDDHLGKPLHASELRLVLDHQTEATAPSEVDSPIRFERLIQTCGGDPEFVREMIASYMETARGLLDRIDEAIKGGDLSRLTAEAHGWKGVNLTMGFEEIASLCRQLEEAGRRGDIAHSRAVSDTIQSAWEKARQTLEDYLKGSP